MCIKIEEAVVDVHLNKMVSGRLEILHGAVSGKQMRFVF